MSFIILSLAVWRIASLFANESGPWDIFLKFRIFLGVEFGEYGAIGTNGRSRLIICVWCSSIWIGGLAALLYYIAPWETIIVLALFALSAVAVLVEETLDRLTRE